MKKMILLLILFQPVLCRADTPLLDRIEKAIDYSDYAKFDEALRMLTDQSNDNQRPISLPPRFKELAEYMLRERMERIEIRDFLAGTFGSVLTVVGLGRCAFHFFPRVYRAPGKMRLITTSRSPSKLYAWGCVTVVGLYWLIKGCRQSYQKAYSTDALKIKQCLYKLCAQHILSSDKEVDE